MASKVGVFLSGILILGCYSYLFRENKFYAYVEHVYVGFAAAQAIILGWQNVRDGALKPITQGKWWFAVPVVLGCLLYARFSKSKNYLARLPMAFMMGVAAGASVTAVIETQFIKQVRATILPLNSLNNVVVVVGTASTLAFFLFIPLGKKEDRAPLGALSYLGRATIMVALGSSYGYTVMSRLSYLVARLQFLFGKWIPLIPQ